MSTYFLINVNDAQNPQEKNRINDEPPVGYELEDGEIYESIRTKKNREKNCVAAEKFMESLVLIF